MESRGKGKRSRFSRTIPSAPLQSSTNPHMGAEQGGGAAHKKPHLPKSDEKACSTAFQSQATFLEGLPNLRSKQSRSFQERARLKQRSLELPYKCAAWNMRTTGEAQCSAAWHAELRPRAGMVCGMHGAAAARKLAYKIAA
ncbi:hypothetical protein [Paenibacillus sp. BJ-4]|uniref:hypothetical protein n=1 Tax=Paenibacillus sp. BJ-4 TaxID=2878097 RepID=UPI001CF0264B|nr:hypothetical protein [Paenibacillus sp. BJ-4]